MKQPESLPLIGRTQILYRGRKLVFFAGCDYFRLSRHPEIQRAITEGLKKYGLSVAASRVTTGNHALYGELESALARFFRAPAAVLVSNGYATNSMVAQTLRGEFTHVFLDARAHVSLRDASRLFDCPVQEFKTRATGDVQRLLAHAGPKAKPILLTDGVYTYEGEVAPLSKYLEILGPRGVILVDDAHGAGVIGRTGRGSLEHAGVPRARIIQTITMSKAFGVYGGAVLCSRELREKIVRHSNIFAGSTPLPLPLAHACLRSLKLIDSEPFLGRLAANVKHIKESLRKAGYDVAMTRVPVVAITPKTASEAAGLRRRLLAHGIFPSFIEYPGGPPGGYLRLVISSEHAKRELDSLLAALRREDFCAKIPR